MSSTFYAGGKQLNKAEMTEEQREETNLYARWKYAPEKKILDEYIGRPIEEVPEEYKEKIEVLRSYGLGKTTYEEVIAFLENHDGRIMRGSFSVNGKFLIKVEMTEEQRKETNLYARWKYAPEKKILEEYAGRPIEEVPEEYREKIAVLRSYGLDKKVRLSKAKQNRDEAKEKHKKTKELEQQVDSQLKKKENHMSNKRIE